MMKWISYPEKPEREDIWELVIRLGYGYSLGVYRAIVNVGDEALKPLYEVLQLEKDNPQKHEDFAEALAEITKHLDSPYSIDTILSILQYEVPEIREFAIRALIYLDAELVLPYIRYIRIALDDHDFQVHKMAVEGVIKLVYDNDNVQALQDAHWRVRYAAAHHFAQNNQHEILIGLLKDPSPYLRRLAAWHLRTQVCSCSRSSLDAKFRGF